MHYGDRITVLRPTITLDAYGDEVASDLAPIPSDVPLRIDPAQTTETQPNEAARADIVTGWTLRTAPGWDIDLQPTDLVSWRGLTLEVIGQVARWPHPLRSGDVHHAVAALQITT